MVQMNGLENIFYQNSKKKMGKWVYNKWPCRRRPSFQFKRVEDDNNDDEIVYVVDNGNINNDDINKEDGDDEYGFTLVVIIYK